MQSKRLWFLAAQSFKEQFRKQRLVISVLGILYSLFIVNLLKMMNFEQMHFIAPKWASLPSTAQTKYLIFIL